MEPSSQEPDGNSLAELPVIDTVGQNAQTSPAYLTDRQGLRTQLLDDADFECERVGSLAKRNMLGPDTEHDIFVGHSVLLRQSNPQRATLEHAVERSAFYEIHFR